MKKILVADDSQTIQRVIRISLSGSSYEISEYKKYEGLVEKVKEVDPDLVLVDFTLTEEVNGYQICQSIKALDPKYRTLLMFGTFDKIDQKTMEFSGVDEHIVKPFDSAEFVESCRRLLEQTGIVRLENLGSDVPATVSSEIIEDWGFNVPPVLGTQTNNVMEDLPPIIGSVASVATSHEYHEPEPLKEESLEVEEVLMSEPTQSSLLNESESIEELDAINIEDIEIEELADISEDEDLWKIDQAESSVDEEISIVDQSLEEIKEKTKSQISFNFKENDEVEGKEAVSEILSDKYSDHLEKIIREVAWEVVPKIAKELIEKQLKEIDSQST